MGSKIVVSAYSMSGKDRAYYETDTNWLTRRRRRRYVAMGSKIVVSVEHSTPTNREDYKKESNRQRTRR